MRAAGEFFCAGLSISNLVVRPEDPVSEATMGHYEMKLLV
jgi:hypothetical protein